MNEDREQKRQADRQGNDNEVRRTPGMKFRRGTHYKIDNLSANQPEIARDHIGDPGKVVRQAFGGCFAFVHGNH